MADALFEKVLADALDAAEIRAGAQAAEVSAASLGELARAASADIWQAATAEQRRVAALERDLERAERRVLIRTRAYRVAERRMVAEHEELLARIRAAASEGSAEAAAARRLVELAERLQASTSPPPPQEQQQELAETIDEAADELAGLSSPAGGFLRTLLGTVVGVYVVMLEWLGPLGRRLAQALSEVAFIRRDRTRMLPSSQLAEELRWAGERLGGHYSDWARAVAEAREEALPELEQDSETVALRRQLEAATTALERSLLERGMLPFLRERINEVARQREEAQRRLYERRLIVQAPGLGQLPNPEHEIPTAARLRLQSLLDRMPEGNIGIAGPRGSGKSTLMRGFCEDRIDPDSQEAPSPPHLRVMVSAPVEYASRDFVLHLFATVCRKVLARAGVDDVDELLESDPALARSWTLALRALLLLDLVIGAVGGAMVIAFLRSEGLTSSAARKASGTGLILAAVAPLIACMPVGRLPLSLLEIRTVMRVVPLWPWRRSWLWHEQPAPRPPLRKWPLLLASFALVAVGLLLLLRPATLPSSPALVQGSSAIALAVFLGVAASALLGSWELRAASDPTRPRSQRDHLVLMAWTMGYVTLTMLALLFAVWGVAIPLLSRVGLRLDPRYLVGLGVVCVAVVLLGVLRTLWLEVRGILRRELPSRQAAPGSGLSSLAQVAARRLREIKFQQTFLSGWSGTLKLPVPLKLPLGIDAQVSGGTTLARVQMTFPEIVDSFRGFVEQAVNQIREVDERAAFFIGIDELDKMESDETARKFLNDIKAIFTIRGCYYLVSISEDAMASFERRGLPFRDVFDSSFDEVVKVDYLDLAGARDLLSKRVVLLPVPFVALCYCLSGGLARDLIRVARNLFEERDRSGQRELSELCRRVVQAELATRTNAVVAAMKGIELEPDVSELLLWLRQPSGPALPGSGLAARHGWFEPDGNLLVDGFAQFRNGVANDQRSPAARQTLIRLGGELVGYYYYSATVLDFFGDGLSDDTLRCAESPESGARSFDHLARSRQTFAVNPRLAWNQVSEFRGSWGLPVAPFPKVLRA
jgi:hypothetical protein